MRSIITSIILAAAMLFSADIYAQKRTDINPGAELDTTFIYNSPRPLVSPELTRGELNNAGGVSLLFSRSGFGVGGFYNRNLSENTVGFISLYISGARNTDEFEVYNYNTGEYFVPGKINRLFNLPLMFGAKYMMFGDALAKSFRPYVSAGAGPSLIMSTPYEQGWFEAWGDVKTYIRPSGFVGLGAYVGGVGGTLLGVNARYYYIPFGGDGLESIKGQPIKDFGGVFLSLSLGARY